MKYNTTNNFSEGKTFSFDVKDDNSLKLSDDRRLVVEKVEGHQNLYYARINDTTFQVVIRASSSGDVEISMNGYVYKSSVSEQRNQAFIAALKQSEAAQNSIVKISAPMPGLIKQIFIHNEQQVRKGENLFVLEAMKMENIIKSPGNGVIHNISTEAGSAVEKGSLLCVIGSK